MQQLSYDGANPSPKTSLLSKSHGGHNHRSSTFAGLSLRLLHTTCPWKTFVCLTIRNAQINNNICGRQSQWWRSSRALYLNMEFTHYIGLTFKLFRGLHNTWSSWVPTKKMGENIWVGFLMDCPSPPSSSLSGRFCAKPPRRPGGPCLHTLLAWVELTGVNYVHSFSRISQ